MSEEAVIHREMGCTRNEFLGWLPGVAGGARFDVDGDSIRIDYHAGAVLIRIAQAADRQIARLSLPVLQVSIQFIGLDEPGRGEFFRRFDLFTRRGGG